MAIAQLLAATLRTQNCRMVVAEWVHPSELKKPIVVSRGWEKQVDQSQLPSRCGGWVARQLVLLLQRKDVKVSHH
jgi:armadillo repeat-containing protein 8